MPCWEGRRNAHGAPVLIRHHLSNALVLLGTLAVLLPLAEGVVRLVAPQPLPSQQVIRSFVLHGMYEADENAGYRLSPGFSGTLERAGHVTEFSTNALGLRGDEIGAKAEPRILALGDSFTFGFGVPQDETWVALLQQALQERQGIVTQTINAGVSGYGTDAALALLRRVGEEVQPDLILLGFFSNDYIENFLGTRNRYAVRDGYLFDEFSSKSLRESSLARESHLYRLAMRGWEQLRPLGLDGEEHPPPGFSAEEFAEGADLAGGLIRELQAEAELLGSRFAVVWIPTDAYTFKKRNPEDLQYRSRLLARVAEAGIPSIDLLPILSEEPHVAGLYLKNDGHHSARGNQVTARALAKWILEEGLLSEP